MDDLAVALLETAVAFFREMEPKNLSAPSAEVIVSVRLVAQFLFAAGLAAGGSSRRGRGGGPRKSLFLFGWILTGVALFLSMDARQFGEAQLGFVVQWVLAMMGILNAQTLVFAASFACVYRLMDAGLFHASVLVFLALFPAAKIALTES